MVSNLIFMKVTGVKFHTGVGAPAVILAEDGTQAGLAILVSRSAARNILAALAPPEERRLGPPLTHEFVTAVAAAAGVNFGQVVIDRVTDEGWFRAKVELRGADGKIVASVDARPSDALPVAIVANAPIAVKREVAAKVGLKEFTSEPYRDIAPGDLEE